jgi:hypothetical protein
MIKKGIFNNPKKKEFLMTQKGGVFENSCLGH